jgi:hypothetical protein
MALEERITPSHFAVAPAMVHALATHTIDLVGSIHGHETSPAGADRAGLVGTGSVSPPGAVNLSGTLIRAHGNAPEHMTVTLRDAHGSVVVALRANPSSTSANPGQADLTYTILGGSGDGKGDRGTGPATFQELLPPGPVGHTANPIFTLVFGASSPTQPLNLVLTGAIQGRYVQPNDSGASSVRMQLQVATGSVTPLGAASGVGFLNVPSTTPGAVDGDMILTASDGTVAIHVSGAAPSFGTFSNVNYTVLGGTGAFAGATGSGTLQLVLGGPILILDPGPGFPQGGREGSYTVAFGDAALPPIPQGM